MQRNCSTNNSQYLYVCLSVICTNNVCLQTQESFLVNEIVGNAQINKKIYVCNNYIKSQPSIIFQQRSYPIFLFVCLSVFLLQISLSEDFSVVLLMNKNFDALLAPLVSNHFEIYLKFSKNKELLWFRRYRELNV